MIWALLSTAHKMSSLYWAPLGIVRSRRINGARLMNSAIVYFKGIEPPFYLIFFYV